MNNLFSGLINQIKAGTADPQTILEQLRNGGQARKVLENEYAKLYPFMNATLRNQNVQNYLATTGIQDFQNALQNLGTWTAPNGMSYTYSNGGLVRNSTQVNQTTVNGQGNYTTSTSYQTPNIDQNKQYLINAYKADLVAGQPVNLSTYGLTQADINNSNTVPTSTGKNWTNSERPILQGPNTPELARQQQTSDLAYYFPTAIGAVNKITGEVINQQQYANKIGDFIGTSVNNSGYTVDPKLWEAVNFKDFMDQATSILDPYYKSQFEQIGKTVSTKLSQLSEDLGTKKSELQRTTDENLRTGRETLAGRGLTFSGQRGAFESTTQDELSRNLDLANTSAYRSGQDLLSQAESKIGTSNIQPYASNPIGGRNLQFGNNITGDLQYQQNNARDALARQFASDENANRASALNKSLYAYNLSKNAV